jgi:hypothetical protein
VSLHSPRADRGGSVLRLTDCGCRSSNPLATPKRITYELLYPRDIPRVRMRDKDWQLRSCRWFQFGQRTELPIVCALACTPAGRHQTCMACSRWAALDAAGFDMSVMGFHMGVSGRRNPRHVYRGGTERQGRNAAPVSKRRRGRLQPWLQHVED